ncbi:hypothetical protein MTO96_013265 [Rhipicephalus appendiculatus]
MGKPTGRGQRYRAIVKYSCLVYARKMLLKMAYFVLANVMARMTVDRHRRRFELETHTDMPRAYLSASKTRNKKTPADKVTLGKLTHKMWRARKIGIVSSTQLCPFLISPPSVRYGRYG